MYAIYYEVGITNEKCWSHLSSKNLDAEDNFPLMFKKKKNKNIIQFYELHNTNKLLMYCIQ